MHKCVYNTFTGVLANGFAGRASLSAVAVNVCSCFGTPAILSNMARKTFISCNHLCSCLRSTYFPIANLLYHLLVLYCLDLLLLLLGTSWQVGCAARVLQGT